MPTSVRNANQKQLIHLLSGTAHFQGILPQQQLEKGPDGSLILRFAATGDKEILAWLYSFLPHVRVLAPESLREKFIAGLQQGLDYQAVT
jgi:predicted DNA-binding transcriptional regulator YafY